MSYMTNGLTFNTLRQANVLRASKAEAYNECEKWGHAQWMQALVGEVGELANFLKKVDRGDFLIESISEDIANELADIQTYLDLLANHLNVDLGEATASKFNKVSKRIGADVFIKYDLSDYVLDEGRAFAPQDNGSDV